MRGTLAWRSINRHSQTRMKPTSLAFLLLLSLAPVFAADTPMLFNGKDLDGWRSPHGTWQLVKSIALDSNHPEHFVATPGEGVMVNNPQGPTVNLISTPEFGDIEVLHQEWWSQQGRR